MVLASAQKRMVIVIGNGQNKFRCIAIDDLTYNLVGVLNEPKSYGQTYEVGNDDILSMDQLIEIASEVTGHSHPTKIHIPLSLIRFVAPIIQRITKSPKGAIKGMLGGLGADMVGDPLAIRKLLPRPLLSYRQAIEAALGTYKKISA